jgi:sugar-specific transcriptional regulator TrmB/DNA-binding CsgD family transcriptional regulator
MTDEVPDRESDNHDIAQLDDLVIKVYEQTLRFRSMTAAKLAERLAVTLDEIELALGMLRKLRLIKPSQDTPGGFVAVSPDVTEVELIAPLELDILDRHKQLAEIREQMHRLTHTFDEVRSWGAMDTIVVCQSAEETHVRLSSAARLCQEEVLTMQPGGSRDEEELTAALPRDLEMLRRGVRMHIIYQHPARTDQPTRSYVADVTAAGAEVRTTDELFDRLIIFDRRIAFIPRHNDEEASSSAVVVREPIIIAFLCRIYEHIWRSATVFDLHSVAYGETFDELKLTIITLLASGLKDDVIAKRLGMSSRTCRRHIASLMSEFGADSRFQAGVAAARAGLVDKT